MSELDIWNRAKAVICRKLNNKWISNKQGFNYITATKAIELLNEAFGIENWSHNSLDVSYIISKVMDKKSNKEIDEYNFIANLKLTIMNRQVIGVGSCSARWNQLDTGYKGAVSDAFKKALTNIGFFMELYPDSTDNPLVWAEQNKASGMNNILGKVLKEKNIAFEDAVIKFSQSEWIGEPVYTTKDQVMHMKPQYLEKFIKFVEGLPDGK